MELGGNAVFVAAAQRDPDLAVVGLTNKLLVVRGARVVSELAAPKWQPSAGAFSLDDRLVAVGGADNKVHVFALEGSDLKEVKVLEGHLGKVLSCRFTADGTKLVTTCAGRNIHVYDLASWQDLAPTGWTAHQSSVNDCAVSRDGRTLISVSTDSNIIVWHEFAALDQFKNKKLEAAHMNGVDKVDFLDDKTYVTVSLNDMTIKVWSL